MVERMMLVLLANFSLNIIGSHVLTRTLFVPLFVWLLVENHSGLDLELGYDKLLPAGWGAGSKRHAVHHRGGKEFFEPYFCWWDNLLVRFHGREAERQAVEDVAMGETRPVTR
jgi:cholesterol 25-hydroxylase